jgi:hypothetical protein
MCLDNQGGGHWWGNPVQLWQCTSGNGNQDWQFLPTPYP